MIWCCVNYLLYSYNLPNVFLMFKVKTNYIKEQHREIVLHQLNDIIRQLNDNVTKTPVVAFPPDIQQPLNNSQSNTIKQHIIQVY